DAVLAQCDLDPAALQLVRAEQREGERPALHIHAAIQAVGVCLGHDHGPLDLVHLHGRVLALDRPGTLGPDRDQRVVDGPCSSPVDARAQLLEQRLYLREIAPDVELDGHWCSTLIVIYWSFAAPE